MRVSSLPANNVDNHVYQHRHLRLTITCDPFYLSLGIYFLRKSHYTLCLCLQISPQNGILIYVAGIFIAYVTIVIQNEVEILWK